MSDIHGWTTSLMHVAPAPNARNPLRYTRPLMLNGLPE